METVLIAGGTGLVGSALSEELEKAGYRVIILTRKPENHSAKGNISYAAWNLHQKFIDDTAWLQADHVINLSGANVMERRWSATFKEEILQSRVQGNLLLAEKISNSSKKIKSFICTSAIGWYGPDQNPNQRFTEEAPANKDFLGKVCQQWEESSQGAEAFTRVCRLRIGIVMSSKGGFVQTMQSPIKMGIAPIPGSGKQMMSWIHIHDLCRMFIFALKHPITGSFNAVAPQPEQLKEVVIGLAKKMGMKFFIPLHAPAIMLKIILGERSVEILKSTSVSCEKIKKEGFGFLYPSLDSALEQITERQEGSI